MSLKLKYEDLSSKQQDRLNSWIHSLNLPVKKTGSLAWINKQSDVIYEHIMNGLIKVGRNKNKPYTANSKRVDVSLLSSLLRNYGHVKKADNLNTVVRQLNDEINTVEKNQEFDESERLNWVSHTEIKTKIDELKKRYDRTRKLIHGYEYLALSLYWYIPPIRNNYCDMHVVKNANEQELLSSNTINYLNEINGKYSVVINFDKVSQLKKKNEKVLVYNKAVLPVDSIELTEIIRESLERYPRDFLFTKVTNVSKPMDCLYFRDTLLKRLFKKEGKKIGINILRSSYITWFYEHNPYINDRDALAVKMRHSRAVAETNYNKVKQGNQMINIDSDNDEPDEQLINNDSVVKQIVKPIVELKQKNECGKFDLKKWGEEYRLKNADKLKIKRNERFKEDPKHSNSQKLLFNLNNCNTSKPRESTIKFYNLKKDNETGKWYIEK
jgi:hypothetical protein